MSIQEAKAHFSSVLKRAEAGETIVVTRHNRPIVELRPVDIDRSVTEVANRLTVLETYIGSVRAPKGFDAARITREDLYD